MSDEGDNKWCSCDCFLVGWLVGSQWLGGWLCACSHYAPTLTCGLVVFGCLIPVTNARCLELLPSSFTPLEKLWISHSQVFPAAAAGRGRPRPGQRQRRRSKNCSSSIQGACCEGGLRVGEVGPAQKGVVKKVGWGWVGAEVGREADSRTGGIDPGWLHPP